MVDPFVRSNRNASRNASDRAGDGCHDHIVQNRNRFIAGHDEYRPVLIIWRFEQPKLALGYQGSAAVMATAFARAS